jgi:cell fate (sporulation/competence/biofilm development) regulator YlbF (YheA/YmcA/DUF963 family)
MQTMIEETPVIRKTKELCQTILDQPDMRSVRQRVSTFIADEPSRAQYEAVVARGQALHEKQQKSQALSGDEVADFERQRDALLKNPVARGFLDAQKAMHEVQESVQLYLGKTLELGRVPGPDDLDGDCGHEGCGCHH